MRILGIETSCDETGIAIYNSDRGLLSHKIYSQVSIHVPFGGVVPELASRDHIKKILLITNDVLSETHLGSGDIDAIAYTAGPGLIGALMVGAGFAKAYSLARGIPAIAVHHMEGHLLAPMLEKNKPEFPFLALLVSGGHTMLIEAKEFGSYKILGESLDDAAGEAFDKVAKMLGLPYPGGAALEKLSKTGNKDKFCFPRPMREHFGFDFSFSGLKTYSHTILQKFGDDAQTKADIAYAFQEAVSDSLCIKCKKAIRKTNIRQLLIAGGVSANSFLRAKLNDMCSRENVKIFYPSLEFCTDNGAMIAYAGYQRLIHGFQDRFEGIKVFPRWEITDIERLDH